MPFRLHIGGPGERLNLVPMNGNLNKGKWKSMEMEWAKAVADGKNVEVQIKPLYSGQISRPDRIEVEYVIDTGRIQRANFTNASGG